MVSICGRISQYSFEGRDLAIKGDLIKPKIRTLLKTVEWAKLMIKFVAKNNDDEQFKSKLKHFYLLSKTRPGYMVVPRELRNKIQEIIHSNLIMQRED